MAKVAIVTGASSGIGKAIAGRLADEGFRLVLNGRRLSPSAESENIAVSSADLLLKETPEELLRTAVERFGSVDYLFVNAGTIESADIECIDIEAMCSMVRLKVESSFRLLYTVLKYMKPRNNGHVFITSSVLGTKTRECSGAYAAANHALEALAEALRMELSATDIQITCIEPGLVQTGLHDGWPVHPKESLEIRNPLQPDEIADIVMDVIGKKTHIRIPRIMVLPKGHRI